MKTFETTDGWDRDQPFEATEAPQRDLTGVTLGDDFLIERLLGRGGMGEVYLARQQSLGRPVALKVLKPELTANPTYLSRFEIEATVVARLNHPNIVQVYTLGRHRDLRYLAMEYVHGLNLRDLLVRKGPLGLIQALSVMRQTCRAMEAAAELGLIHRDIKPENLLMTTKGVVKVADFGLCRQQGAEAMHLTQEGVTLGTPMYMSPEQVRGQDLDHRSDLYSMGVTFYHLLSGMAPFRAENPVALALKHLQENPIDLGVHRDDLPRSLVDLVMKLMAKRREDRYATALEVDRELQRIRSALAAIDASGASTPTLKAVDLDEEPSGEAIEEPRPRRRARGVARLPHQVGPPLLLALGAFGIVVGAAIGWSGRGSGDVRDAAEPPSTLAWLDPDWAAVPRQATPRDQLRLAQLESDPEKRKAALVAVTCYHPKDSEFAMRAAAMLALELLGDRDDRTLEFLAMSLDGDAESGDRQRRLAQICRGAVALLRGDVDRAWSVLTTLDQSPALLEPDLSSLLLEVVDCVPARPGGEAASIPWSKLRTQLNEALGISERDFEDRSDSTRPLPSSRP